MKKLLMGAICLALFSLTLSLVQISCSKIEAQNSSSQITALNKIIYLEEWRGSVPGMGNIQRFSIINYDGTGLQHLNIPFPAGFSVGTFHPPVLSLDGTKVFFTGRETANTIQGIYSCDTSGTNLVRIITGDPNALGVYLGGAY